METGDRDDNACDSFELIKHSIDKYNTFTEVHVLGHIINCRLKMITSIEIGTLKCRHIIFTVVCSLSWPDKQILANVDNRIVHRD